MRMREWLQELHCAKAFRHILIKHAHHTNQVMVCMIVSQYPFQGAEKLTARLQENFPEIKSILCIENRRSDNVILDGRETLLAGQPYIEEELLGCRFRISARSFYQINPSATEILYSTALKAAELTGKETVIDLYCGTGTIGILASMHAGKVYGIEIVADAVADARINAGINHADNIEFFTADAEEGASRLLKSHVSPDVVIVDPPRKGCSRNTLDAVIRMNPKRLVYVSCDPATLARDCAYMISQGWQIDMVQPVDMFPGTIHVETVVQLINQNAMAKHHVKIGVDAEDYYKIKDSEKPEKK
jgi:23S rRNA (uracil1939-C5)-methyltransferase